jgi:hypothetical protein
MQIPKVGSQVVVTTQYRSVLLGDPEFILRRTQGIVLAPDKWLSPNEFMVATGNPTHPKAVIHTSRVKHIDYVSGSGTTISSSTRTFKVTSKSSGKAYIVTADGGKVSCTCTGFSYRKTCKHSQKVSDHIRNKNAN